MDTAKETLLHEMRQLSHAIADVDDSQDSVDWLEQRKRLRCARGAIEWALQGLPPACFGGPGHEHRTVKIGSDNVEMCPFASAKLEALRSVVLRYWDDRGWVRVPTGG